MEGKLIKLGLTEGYRLDDSNGNYIASTLNGKTRLSVKNCEVIELGYDLDELARQEAEKIYNKSEHEDYNIWEYLVSGEVESIKIGFKKALEIMGDKKFSEKDIERAFIQGVYTKNEIHRKKEEYIQSLQQTEWDVEVEMEPYYDGNFVNDGKTHIIEPKWRPVLDNDGCLILKRI